MDNLIKGLEQKAFSGNDILTICDKKTKIVTYRELAKYKSIDQLLKPYNNVTLLYETRPSYGHWVCLIKHTPKGRKPYIEFFDSYAFPVDGELEYIQEDFRPYPMLSKLLLKSGYPIIYNTYPLQEVYEDVSSCGRHVAFRIVMKDTPLKKYIKLMTTSKYDPDMLVTYLTAFQ